MKIAVLLKDNPGTGTEIRQRHMPEHLAFLDRHAAKIQAAGPLKTADGEAAGGLWVVDAKDANEVEHLVRTDPFWQTGLRKSVRTLLWSQVFAEGRRLTSA